MSKKCFICGEPKPISEFYAHPMMADGHLNKCKECCKTYARGRNTLPSVQAYSIKKGRRPKHQARNAVYQATHKEMARAAKDAYSHRNPAKKKAQTAVGNAIRDGRLSRGPCEVNGCEKKAQAHHDDYSKPLEVRWMCSRHHSDHHNAIRDKERIANGIPV